MLFCVDIGNTNITMGLYRGEDLVAHWRVSTDHLKMPDEYGILLLSLMARQGYQPSDIAGIALASVVPPVTDLFLEMLDTYIGVEPLIVGAGVRTGVAVRYDNPHEVGADRVVNAAAAYRLYGGPTCIVDFGTGTTFDAISATGDYLGGAIAPGVRVSAEALFQRASKLPRIDLSRPRKAIGTNTADSMRSGILFGYVGLVEGMVERFRRELGPTMRVIGTGGLARSIAQETDVIEVVDLWLTLRGLQIIYELNRGAQ
ncbi:MAG TPA: type III pantothenate kinase [Chloroflexi bacterium]|jgi:type III pantothenate kinase|nr:type III pantothenate kinase [Chloroflexota bacterium]